MFIYFIHSDSNLSDYSYIHKCLKLNEQIKLSLHAVASLHKPFLRKHGDDDEPIYMIKVTKFNLKYVFLYETKASIHTGVAFP